MTEESSSIHPVSVVVSHPQSDVRWDAYVEQHPEGLIYHHSTWLKVLQQVYGYRLLALACEDAQGRIRGVLPLFYKSGLLTGRRLVSLPHTPIAGPLAEDETSAKSLIHGALQSASPDKNLAVELKLSFAAEALALNGMVAEPWVHTYVLNFPLTGSPLRFGNSRNHNRLKWSVQKAGKLAVTARWAENKLDLQHWYDLYLRTMRRHAVPPRQYSFFEIAWTTLHPRGFLRLLLAEKAGSQTNRLLAGSIFLCLGKTVFYAFNGSRETELSFRPNDLIQWTALHRFFAEGYRRYDFGEVNGDNRGLAEFKLKWGAEPILLLRTYYPKRASSTLMSRPERLQRLVMRGWRLLPLRTTATVGRWIYRYV